MKILNTFIGLFIFATQGNAAVGTAAQLVWSQNIGNRAETAVEFSFDGNFIASSGLEGTITIWDAHSGAKVKEIPSHVSESHARAIHFHPSKNLLLVGSTNGEVSYLSVPDGVESPAIYSHQSQVNKVVTSKDGSLIASVSGTTDFPDKNSTIVWDVASGKALYTFMGYLGAVNDVAFSKNAKRVAVGTRGPGCGQGEVSLYNLQTGAKEYTVDAHGWVEALVFSPNQEHIMVGLYNGKLNVLEAHSGNSVQSYSFRQGIWALRYSPDEKSLAIGSGFDTTLVNATTFVSLLTLQNSYDGQNFGVAFSPTEDLVAIAKNHPVKSVSVWQLMQ